MLMEKVAMMAAMTILAGIAVMKVKPLICTFHFLLFIVYF